MPMHDAALAAMPMHACMRAQSAMRAFDRNNDGVLQRDEFVDFASEMMRNGPDGAYRSMQHALVCTQGSHM